MGFLKKTLKNLVNVPRGLYREVEKSAGIYTISIVLKNFEEMISEMEKALEQETNYQNYQYWQGIGIKLSFDSKKDTRFAKQFAKAIKKKEIRIWHLDYIAGRGMYKNYGLLDYVKKRKNELLMKALNKWGVKDESEIHEKAKQTKEETDKIKKKIPKKELKKQTKKVQEEAKHGFN
jgi:hypothetical protein